MSESTATVLVADDDESILRQVEKVLLAAGFTVCTATSGEDALEVTALQDIDLAVLDYRMPGLDGIEAGGAIFRLTGRRFILMSAFDEKEMFALAATHGALGFLAKPFQRHELIGQVQIALKRNDEFDTINASIKDMASMYDDNITKLARGARSMNTAEGVLMELLQVDRDTAYHALVRQARQQSLRLVDFCEQLIKSREETYARKKNSR